ILHERLSGRAEDTRLSGLSAQKLLDAAYLVPRADCEEFVELVDRTKGTAPEIRVELTGPWAAYSFTEPTGEPATEPTPKVAAATWCVPDPEHS
ncbi:GvpL/GvpF family gas vesicle protein, partial [Streptomyces sp. NPDC059627]